MRWTRSNRKGAPYASLALFALFASFAWCSGGCSSTGTTDDGQQGGNAGMQAEANDDADNGAAGTGAADTGGDPGDMANAEGDMQGSNTGNGNDTAGTGGGTNGAAESGAAGTGAETGADDDGPAPAEDYDTDPEPPPEAMQMLDPDVDWTALDLIYPTMYSAYDGEHLFKVPVRVDGIEVDLSDWQAIPESAVGFDPDPDNGGVMITVLEPVAEVTIAASSGSVGGTAQLHITEGTPDQWAIGEYRYTNGVEWIPTIDFSMVDIFNFDTSQLGIPTPPTDLSCNNCHTTGAAFLEVQHTPTQIAHISDEELIGIFTMGIKPERLPYRVLPEPLQYLYAEMHTWDATEEEEKGLVIYLRSLTPAGMGDIVLPDGSFIPPEGLDGVNPADFQP